MKCGSGKEKMITEKLLLDIRDQFRIDLAGIHGIFTTGI